eukprot:6172592-Prymnesium_polylepis.1
MASTHTHEQMDCAVLILMGKWTEYYSTQLILIIKRPAADLSGILDASTAPSPPLTPVASSRGELLDVVGATPRNLPARRRAERRRAIWRPGPLLSGGCEINFDRLLPHRDRGRSHECAEGDWVVSSDFECVRVSATSPPIGEPVVLGTASTTTESERERGACVSMPVRERYGLYSRETCTTPSARRVVERRCCICARWCLRGLLPLRDRRRCI